MIPLCPGDPSAQLPEAMAMFFPCPMQILKGKIFMILVEDSKQTLLKGGLGDGCRTTAMLSYSGDERWVSAPNTAWASGSYSQGAGYGPVGGKLLQWKHQG